MQIASLDSRCARAERKLTFGTKQCIFISLHGIPKILFVLSSARRDLESLLSDYNTISQ